MKNLLKFFVEFFGNLSNFSFLIVFSWIFFSDFFYYYCAHVLQSVFFRILVYAPFIYEIK